MSGNDFDFRKYMVDLLVKATVDQKTAEKWATEFVALYDEEYVRTFSEQLGGSLKNEYIEAVKKTKNIEEYLLVELKYPNVDKNLVTERAITKALPKIENLLRDRLTDDQAVAFVAALDIK